MGKWSREFSTEINGSSVNNNAIGRLLRPEGNSGTDGSLNLSTSNFPRTVYSSDLLYLGLVRLFVISF
jgi:hypothetical protein